MNRPPSNFFQMFADSYLSAGVLAPLPLGAAPPTRRPGGLSTPGSFFGAEPSPLGTDDGSGAEGASGFELQPAVKVQSNSAICTLRIEVSQKIRIDQR